MDAALQRTACSFQTATSLSLVAQALHLHDTRRARVPFRRRRRRRRRRRHCRHCRRRRRRRRRRHRPPHGPHHLSRRRLLARPPSLNSICRRRISRPLNRR